MTSKIIDHKFIAYIVSSIIPLLSISIFLADLTLSILSIVFLIFLIRDNFFIFYKNIFFLISMVFYFICLSSSFFSEDIFFSLKSSIPLLRMIIFIFLISYLIQNNQNFITVFYDFMKFTLLIIVIYGLISYFYTYVSWSVINESGDTALDHRNIRLTLPFSDEQKLGSYIVRLYGLFIAIHIIKKKNNKFENIFLFFLTFFSSLTILLSGERSSLFFMLLILFICMILLDIGFKIKIIYLLSILFVFISLLTMNNNLSKRIIFDKNNQLSLNSTNVIIFTPQHTAHYKTALNIFFDKPIIGQGPKMFRKLCHKKEYNEYVHNFSGCSSHPHNTYIQLLAETGLISAILFSLGFFHIIINFIRHFLSLIIRKGKKLSNYQILINITALIVFWPFSPSGNFFNNWICITYAFPLGFYVNEYFSYKKYNKS